jgi:hypothetical protein
MNRRINLSYDTEKHALVHLGLTNHNEPSDSAYMRKCIEFFEMNKGGAVNQQLILERLARIELMLKNGTCISAAPAATADDDTDDIFDEALEQL